MSFVGTHIYRRSLNAVTYVDDNKVKIELPAGIILMLILTFALFAILDVMIEYTFGKVIPTLIMIESAHDTIDFEPLATEDTDDSIAKDPEQTTRPSKQYISGSFRRSYKLLKTEGSRFSGFFLYFVNKIVVGLVAVTLAFNIGFLPYPVYAVLASVICAQLSLTWTHIVISKPSPKYWFRRIPSARVWKKIALPTALHAVATQCATAIPMYLSSVLGLEQDPNKVVNLPQGQQAPHAGKTFGVLVLSLVLSIFLVIPATIVLTRMQASLLNDTEETIVPFDRTFNGKVVPEIVGGSGMINIVDAWTTFDWAAGVRLVKAYFKTAAMLIALFVVFALVFVVEFLVTGIDWNKVLVPADRSL